MKVRREVLVRHLEKITCRGQIKEAVFKEGFATQALSDDQHLLVLAPSLGGIEPLAKEIGLADLDVVVKNLNYSAGEGNEATDVDLRIEDDRLLIEEEDNVGKLMTASPKTIGTRVEDSTVEKLLAKVDGKKSIALTRRFIDGLCNRFTGIKAAEIEIFVGPKGGKVRVGHENSHMWEFPSKELKAKESYSVLFGEHLVDVLAQITDFSTAALTLGGAGTLILIQDGEYRYLLAPKTRSADEKASGATEKK